MNKDQLEGKWKQLKGRAKAKWGELTDDDLEEVKGRQQVLVGKIQERYGHGREAATKAVDGWIKEQEDDRGSE